MDLYRFFHPHYNPRLRGVPLRLQELSELHLAAVELTDALKRAELRPAPPPVNELKCRSLGDAIEALGFAIDTLAELIRKHPGDETAIMRQLMRERANAPGWETWTALVRERIRLIEQHQLPDDSNCVQETPSFSRLDSASAKAIKRG